MLTRDDLIAIEKLINKGVNIGTKSVKQDFKKYIDRKFKLVIDFFDRDYLNLKKRVDRIDSHLDLPPMQ